MQSIVLLSIGYHILIDPSLSDSVILQTTVVNEHAAIVLDAQEPNDKDAHVYHSAEDRQTKCVIRLFFRVREVGIQ